VGVERVNGKDEQGCCSQPCMKTQKGNTILFEEGMEDEGE
jgi:hypothetical protein